MNLKGDSENWNILVSTHPCVCACAQVCVCEGNEMRKNKHTVRIVGVTKAQQILQNRFGWKPIIISMSSQNLCRPAEKNKEEEKWSKRAGKTEREFKRRRQWEWPGYNKVFLKGQEKIQFICVRMSMCVFDRQRALSPSMGDKEVDSSLSLVPHKRARKQTASFLCLYWRITLSDMKTQSHTIISIWHLYWCPDKMKESHWLCAPVTGFWHTTPVLWGCVGPHTLQQRHPVDNCGNSSQGNEFKKELCDNFPSLRCSLFKMSFSASCDLLTQLYSP